MGFDPILDTNDFLRKPTGLTDGDLLYWSSGDLARLPIGSTGQIPQVSGGLPSWANGTKDLFFARYGITAWDIQPYEVFSSPILLSEDTNEYSTTATSSTLQASYGSLLSLGYLQGYIAWEMEAKRLTATSYVQMRNGSTGSPTTYTYYSSGLTSSYVTYGSNATILGSPTLMEYNNNFSLWIYTSPSGTIYTRNNKLWITEGIACKRIPTIINSSWLTSCNFSAIKSIELFDDGDSIKIDNDANLIFTGSSSQPEHIFLSSAGVYWDNSDYDGITQVEIISGNPLIVFEKA